MFGKIKEAQRDFMRFAAYDKVLLTGAAAICVGLATKEAIGEFMNEIVLPFVLFAAKGSVAYLAYSKAVEKTMRVGWIHALLKGFGKTIWIFLVWLLILYVTYAVFKKVITIDFVTPRVEMVENAATYLRGGHAMPS